MEKKAVKALLWDQIPVNVTSGQQEVTSDYWAARGINDKLVIVIDDDPTGIQTVNDIYVYTAWSEDILLNIFQSQQLVYFQTNSRSMRREEAIRINQQICKLIIGAAEKTGRRFSIISRGDSSMRGHYPAEPAAIREVLEKEGNVTIDGEIIIPFFPEAGRYTFEDVHYIAEGEMLIPVGETEFARDKVFGFENSDLKYYIAEKTNEATKPGEVLSISLDMIRGNTSTIESELLKVTNFQKVIVNALCYEDLMAFVLALLRVEQQGRRFIFRTAAAFVKVYGFIPSKPVLEREDFSGLSENKKGVLLIVGSHTEKTTRQINALKDQSDLDFLEISVQPLMTGIEERQSEVNRIVTLVNNSIASGRNALVFTSRTLLTAEGEKEENLIISNTVSTSLSEIVRHLSVRPAFLICKGGITSSDIVVKGLDIKRALVIGQALPGIPVIQGGEDCKWPSLPVVIFPGNVGSDSALLEVYRKCAGVYGTT